METRKLTPAESVDVSRRAKTDSAAISAEKTKNLTLAERPMTKVPPQDWKTHRRPMTVRRYIKFVMVGNVPHVIYSDTPEQRPRPVLLDDAIAELELWFARVGGMRRLNKKRPWWQRLLGW